LFLRLVERLKMEGYSATGESGLGSIEHKERPAEFPSAMTVFQGIQVQTWLGNLGTYPE
jgi:hypothetical protein